VRNFSEHPRGISISGIIAPNWPAIRTTRARWSSTQPPSRRPRRGEYVASLFHSYDPATSASYVVMNSVGSESVANVSTTVGGSSSTRVTPPTGQLTVDTSSQFGDNHPASFVVGEVGPGVTGVSLMLAADLSPPRCATVGTPPGGPGKALPTGPL